MVNQQGRFFQQCIFMFYLSLQVIFVGCTAILFQHQFDGGHTAGLIGYFCIFVGIVLPFVFFYRIFHRKSAPISNQTDNKNAFVEEQSFQNLTAQDSYVFSFIKKFPYLILPFVMFLLSTIIFLLGEVKWGWLWKLFSSGPVWMVLVYGYTILFVIISFFMLSYMAVGEIFQRKLSYARRHFIVDMLLDYIAAIPFIIIFSFVFLLFLSSKRKKNSNILLTSSTRMLGLFSLIAIKYYIYLNLAMIAFEDRVSGMNLKDSFQMLKKEAKSFAKIFYSSGIVLTILFFNALLLWCWNEKFHWFPSNQFGIGVIILMLISFLYSLFMEQIAFLLHFIKTRHPQCLE